MLRQYAVSVIVPVFKVERFIARCCQYLFEQSLEQVEFIFVDDCSPDHSMRIVQEVLANYPARSNDVRIIKHAVNKGLPSARNSGLRVARGAFVFHCDSDDWMEKEALSKMYQHAMQHNADIVWCDWYLSFKDNERYISQSPPAGNMVSGKEGIQLMFGGRVRYNVWNKLVRRSIYENQHIQFPDGYGMGEDMTMVKLFVYANKVCYLPMALYHYVQLNEEALTKKTAMHHLQQIRYNVDQLVVFLHQHYGESMEESIQFFKLNIKLPFLISADERSYQRWLDWYPEANSYIDQNPMFSMRTKFIQKMAIKRQFWLLKLYYYLVIRVVYGIIYK